MGKHRLITASLAILVTQLIGLALSFSTNTIVARIFGPEAKGIFSLILMSGLLLYAFSNLGLTNSFVYYIAKHKPDKNVLACLALKLGALPGVLFGIAYFFFYLYTRNSFLRGITPFQAILIGASAPVFLIQIFFANIALGSGEVSKFNGIKLINGAALLSFLGLGLIFRVQADLLVLPWFFANLLCFLWSLSFFQLSRSNWKQTPQLMRREMLSYGIKGYVADLMSFFTYRLDVFLINYFVDSAAVGMYSIAVSLAELLWYIPGGIQTVLTPKIAATSEEDARYLVVRVCRMVLCLTIALSIVFYIFSGPLIGLIFGDAYATAARPLALILPGIVSLSITKIISSFFMGRGKPIYCTYVSTATFVLIGVLDILMIPVYRIEGAAIASSLAYFTSALFSIYLFSSITRTRFSELVFLNRMDLIFCWEVFGDLVGRLRQNSFRAS